MRWPKGLNNKSGNYSQEAADSMVESSLPFDVIPIKSLHPPSGNPLPLTHTHRHKQTHTRTNTNTQTPAQPRTHTHRRSHARETILVPGASHTASPAH